MKAVEDQRSALFEDIRHDQQPTIRRVDRDRQDRMIALLRHQCKADLARLPH
jgi:hypothetical protein